MSENLWTKKNYPHKGWEFSDMTDFEQDYQTCEMCNNYPVRYMHYLTHPTLDHRVGVGCVCAEKLCTDYDGAGTQKQYISHINRTKRFTKQKERRMSLVTPDMSEAQKPLEPGVYPARIIAADAVESKAGKAMLKWTLETFGSDDAGFNGKRVITRTMLVGKGIFKTQEMYKAATGEPLTGPFDTEQLIGSEVRVSIVDGMDQHGNPSGWPEVKSVSKYA